MSKSSKAYYDLCEADNWRAEYEAELQANDPDYEMISIDYSQKSWEEFSADLLNPDSKLMKDLNNIIEGAKPF